MEASNHAITDDKTLLRGSLLQDITGLFYLLNSLEGSQKCHQSDLKVTNVIKILRL